MLASLNCCASLCLLMLSRLLRSHWQSRSLAIARSHCPPGRGLLGKSLFSRPLVHSEQPGVTLFSVISPMAVVGDDASAMACGPHPRAGSAATDEQCMLLEWRHRVARSAIHTVHAPQASPLTLQETQRFVDFAGSSANEELSFSAVSLWRDSCFVCRI
jgi:hypothetical protein